MPYTYTRHAIITQKTKRGSNGEGWLLQQNVLKEKKRDVRDTTGRVPRTGKFARHFSSFSKMNAWLNGLEATEYKIGMIDWVNSVAEV